MKVFNPLQSQKVSGAWNSLTFYNYGDLTVARQTPIPSQPNTPRQIEVRSHLAVISRVWSTDLTDGQRTAWKNFAMDFIWTDLWGREFVLKGIALFTKFNFPLIDNGKTLQITPPPAVNPSELNISSVSNTDGEVTIEITPATPGEIAAQSPFIDVWVTEISNLEEITAPPERAVFIRGVYKPPGVNPVKSDFRHRVYINEITDGEPPASVLNQITLQNPDGEAFTSLTRLALIFRRYNKFGRYSTAQRVSIVSTIAP